MKILMATDGSKEADIALRSASRLLKTGDVYVDLLSVAVGFPASSSKAGFSQLRENYHRRILPETRRILERAQKTLCAEGAGEIHLIFETGSPARVIADLAADYDLTVIGAKGREDRSRGGGLGPVASAVVNHASGAIYIGRAIRADRGARILVALEWLGGVFASRQSGATGADRTEVRQHRADTTSPNARAGRMNYLDALSG
jgi:nucleotide-binding universal stress UspA family protein